MSHQTENIFEATARRLKQSQPDNIFESVASRLDGNIFEEVHAQLQTEPSGPGLEPLMVEPDKPGLLQRGFEFARPFGEEIVKVGQDILGLPGRALESANVLAQGAAVAATLPLEQLGIIEQGFQPSVSPEEAQDVLTASAIDAALLAIPATRLAAPLAKGAGTLAAGTLLRAGLKTGTARAAAKLARSSVRGGASFAKFSALIPSEEEDTASLGARAESAFGGALFGAATPLLGKLLAPVGRVGQLSVSNAVKYVTKLLPERAPEKVLRSTAKQLERLYLASFFKRTPQQLLEVDLPKLFQPLAKELRDVLSAAGRIIEPELETIAAKGTISKEAGAILGKIAKEAFPDTGTVLISEARVRGIKTAVLTVGAAMQAAGKRLEAALARKQIDPEIITQFRHFEAFYDALATQFIKHRRVAGRILQSFQQGVDRDFVEALAVHLERVGIGISETLNRVSVNQSALQQLKNEIASGQAAEAGKTFIRRVWRPLLFPITSFVADTYSNGVRLISKGGESLVADVFDVVGGKAPVATEGLLRGIIHSAKTKFPGVLTPTAFSEQLRTVFGPNLDRVLLSGAVLKRGVDGQFAKVGFFSSLYSDALSKANELGLKGIERTTFTRRFVLEATEKSPEVLAKAIKAANELRFLEPLSKLEERIADSTAVQLLLSPFARFGFQYIRWIAEFTPLNPKFLKKVITNSASSRDFTEFVLKNMAGMGAVYATDMMVYDNVDFDTMEYVDPDTKERRSLSGFSPQTELLGVVAIFRGDSQNAMKAFERGSIGFLARQGLADEVLTAFERIRQGASPRVLIDELEDVLASMFPAKSVLAGMAAVFGQEPRTGLGRVIPGLGRERLDPLTGGPARQQRVISVGLPTGPAIQTEIVASPALGSRLTGRKLNAVEQLFEDADESIRFPSASGLFNPNTGDEYERVGEVPIEIIEAFNQEVGVQRGRLLKGRFPNQEAIDTFQKLPLEQQKRQLRKLKSEASTIARRIINARLRAGKRIGGESGGATIGERLSTKK